MAPRQARHSTKAGGRSRTILPDYHVSEWSGLNTYIKDIKQLADGQTPDSLNWVTSKYSDNIQLRRGYALLGTTRNAGTGRISGLGVGTSYNGTQVLYFTYDRKVKTYDTTANDTVEVNTADILPTAASGEDVSVMPYENVAGSFVYFTSPNSSIYKIVTQNAKDITNLQSTNWRGNAKLGNNRMFLWNRNDTYNNKYLAQLVIGVTDKVDVSSFSQTTGENVGTGDGATKTFTGTLAYRASNAKATCFGTEFAAPIDAGVAITGISKATNAVVTVASHSLVVGNCVLINGVSGMTQINNKIYFVTAVTSTTITLNVDSTGFNTWTSGGTIFKSEYFIDDKIANLASVSGGTGTINYTTGAFSLTFNTAPTNSQIIYAQYYTEDSTNGGVADFTIDGATNGLGKYFSQFDGGGAITGVFPFDQVQYCFHILKTWYLTLTTDDTKAQNLPYRSQLGTPYFRGGIGTDDGILFLDTSLPSRPIAQLLTIDNNSATAVITVVPYPISNQLDLSSYGFNLVAVYRWGDYDIVACAESLNGVLQTQNTKMFVRNVYSTNWDLVDYCASCFATYNGTLLSGDSLSNNVYTLFSGLDDDGSLINNHWTSKMYNLGVDGLKKTNRFRIKGLIQQTQNIDISFSYDSGNFTKVATVQGTGSYVNIGNPTTVGANTIGSQVIGGGGLDGSVTAYPFEVEFTIAGDSYEYVQLQFQANNIGFVQIDEFAFVDNRYKGRHILPSRTV